MISICWCCCFETVWFVWSVMEPQRGVCTLCSENTRVLTSSDAEEFSKLLPELLYENFLTNSEFQKIKNSVKVCVICCFKIKTAVERKKVIDGVDKNNNKENKTCCHFCKTDQCLMKVGSNWKYFTDRTEGYVNLSDFPVCACPKCLFFFDVIYNFKTKLTYKFPHLAIQKKKKSSETPQKQNDTPKRKSLSKSPPSSTKRKIFDNCFTYLQPLCNNNYHVEETLKKDVRLYKKIAYVNLEHSKNVDIKETPKLRPVIKIKLKPRHRKSEKEISNEKSFVKLSKSEEVPSKIGQNKSRKRRHSHIEKKPSEDLEETLQETPKAAGTENLVPKRRVSEYIENAEKENEETKEEDQEETKEEDRRETEEKIDTETDKCTPEETVTEEKLDLPKEDETELEESVDIHKNGIEEPPDTENADTDVSPIVETNNVVNGERSEETAEEPEEEKEKSEEQASEEERFSDSSKNSPTKSPPRSVSGSDGNDSDTSDKDKSKDVSESDVLNGSERKKKRVTFSDEVND